MTLTVAPEFFRLTWLCLESQNMKRTGPLGLTTLTDSVVESMWDGPCGLHVAELYPQVAVTELLLGIVVRRSTEYREL